jgi:beta-galactosidase
MRKGSKFRTGQAAFFLSVASVAICLAVFTQPSSYAQAAGASAGRASVAAAPAGHGILLGTAWYPEQWPESRWDADLRLMQAAHIRVVRVGEFAWSTMEPSEGNFHFGWLERAIALAAKHGIVTVLGTPTAAPPVWMATRYPDILRIRRDGRRAGTGNRAEESLTSPRYLRFCAQIAGEMAKRFGHNPNVVGWQIDNEFSYANMSYDAITRHEFDHWLKAKYKTLANLNQRWTTAYWSETYDNWNEIPIPIGGHNPALMLEWKRFVTYTWYHYQQNQIDAIRRYADPRQFITDNFMGFFNGLDSYKVAQPLTLAAWDDYVGSGHVNPVYNGLSHDLVRGFKRKDFWVMETQPSRVDWVAVNNSLNKGEVRAMAWQAVGHGANAVLYWQWRSALNGQEQYHGTLVGPDGQPVPAYSEIQSIGADFAKVGNQFQGTTPVSQVALLNSYDSRWAIDFQKLTDKYSQVGQLESYYRALQPLAQSIDVVSPDAPLDGYKLVVAPGLNILPRAMARHLMDYVRNGGNLILGPLSGMKNQFSELLTQRQPGFLAAPLGGRVDQYYALEKDVPLSGVWGSGKATIWAERMSVSNSSTRVLMRYGKSNGWLDNEPAVLTRRYGKGRITYIGAILGPRLMAAAAKWMAAQSGVKPVFGAVPEGVYVSRRVGAGKEIFVLVNYSKQSRVVALPHAMKSLLAGGEVTSATLHRYGVAVLEERIPKAASVPTR